MHNHRIFKIFYLSKHRSIFIETLPIHFIFCNLLLLATTRMHLAIFVATWSNYIFYAVLVQCESFYVYQCMLLNSSDYLLQGQYKSTLTCPTCSKTSVTFDPFMYLSLPVPSTAKRVMTVTVFSTDGSREPCSYDVSVPKFGTLSDLVQALSIVCLLGDDEILLVTEVWFPFLVAPFVFFCKFSELF